MTSAQMHARTGWILRVLVAGILFWGVAAGVWLLSTMVLMRPLTEQQKERVTNLGNIVEYRDSDATLAPDPGRVVFFGDSITKRWNLEASFHNPHFINRGINGQTTADMLVRFRQDVIDLHPRAVVILAGVNDLGEHNRGGDDDGAHKLQNIEANDETMAELSEIHGIRPIFGSLLPIHDYTKHGKEISRAVSTGLLVDHNEWLRAYCAQHGYQFVDYYKAMVDERGRLKRELSDDGIHPNDAGYAVMAQVFSATYHE